MSQDPIKIVLAGCGKQAGAWANALNEVDDARIVGLYDLEAENARGLAERHGLKDAEVHDDGLGSAIERTAADVVCDLTVPEAHEAVTVEALGRGCHVIGEKPMSTSLDSARRMVEAARRAGRLYAVMQNRRYMPAIVGFRDFLQGGGLGEIEEIHAEFYVGAHFGGFRAEMAHPLLLDMAVHTLDQARFIGGLEPVAVYCHSFNPGRSWYRGDASAVAIFEMDNGAVFSYRGSWCADGRNTSWESHWRAIGPEGSATWDGHAELRAETIAGPVEGLFPPKAETEIPVPEMAHSGHAGGIREFLACVRNGTRPQTHCEDNIKTMAMVFAAVESADTGRRVEVQA